MWTLNAALLRPSHDMPRIENAVPCDKYNGIGDDEAPAVLANIADTTVPSTSIVIHRRRIFERVIALPFDRFSGLAISTVMVAS